MGWHKNRAIVKIDVGFERELFSKHLLCSQDAQKVEFSIPIVPDWLSLWEKHDTHVWMEITTPEQTYSCCMTQGLFIGGDADQSWFDYSSLPYIGGNLRFFEACEKGILSF